VIDCTATAPKDPVALLREARAVLEAWKDVVPAVSLCADIDQALMALSQRESGLHKKGYPD
jgi:hypothetical protein